MPGAETYSVKHLDSQKAIDVEKQQRYYLEASRADWRETLKALETMEIKRRSINTSNLYLPPSIPENLIVGYDTKDSFLNARELDIVNFRHVEKYADMLKYSGLTVYITERGRDRKDYAAIEGLFIYGNHRVIDLME